MIRTVSFVVALSASQSSGRVTLGQTLPRCLGLSLTEYSYSTSAGAAQPPYIFQFGDGAFPQSETNSLMQQGFILKPEHPLEHCVYNDHGRVVSDSPQSGNNSFSFTIRHADGSPVNYDHLILHFTCWVLDRKHPSSDALDARHLLYKPGFGVDQTTRELGVPRRMGEMLNTLRRENVPSGKY